MRHPVLTAVLALTTLGAGAALADDDCDAPMADWQPRSAVQQMAESKGWTVQRIKTDDGCYEIKGRNANGEEIEVKVDPATLEILEVETEDGEDDDDEGDGVGSPSINAPDSQGAAPGLNPAPKNRLINGNSQPSAVVE
jgi:hypothetical protein